MGNYTGDSSSGTHREKQQYAENSYLAKIKAIPPVSDEEANLLLAKWQEFGDLKARNRAIEGSLHLVPPIARSATRRFRFTGPSVLHELVGAGALGLTQAADCFDPFDPEAGLWTHYARRCIRNESIRAAKRLLSVVDRPYGIDTPMDMLLDPMQPDPVSPEDYCGSRARATTGSDRQEEPIASVHQRLRPWPKEWEVRFKKEESLETKIYDLRKAGLTLKETAERLGMNITKVWRTQKAYMEARQHE
jgi:hypothetical protein